MTKLKLLFLIVCIAIFSSANAQNQEESSGAPENHRGGDPALLPGAQCLPVQWQPGVRRARGVVERAVCEPLRASAR